MSARPSFRRRIWAIPAAGLLAALLALLALPSTSLAHPLDVYLQSSYVTVDPTQISVELDLSPGVLLAPQVLAELDSDGDEVISDTEARAYVATIVDKLQLTVDDQPLTLATTSIDMPAYLNIQAGYGLIRVYTQASLPAGLSGAHQLGFVNGYQPTGSAWQVNAFVDNGSTVDLGAQNRNDNQQSMTMNFSTDGSTVVDAKNDATGSAQVNVGTEIAGSGQTQRLISYFETPSLSPSALMIALGLALLLGALHALTPGHGKTLVAAYLVGSRGTVRHAAYLGAIVTITHTSSVIAIGLVALFASKYIVPSVLVPSLEVISGLLVIFLGARLAWQRWSAYRSKPGGTTQLGVAHESSHDHDHVHDHDLDAAHDYAHAHGLVHDHGDGKMHSHLPPEDGVRFKSLLAMGISGGMVPCPEALGIMIIAIGLNRILLGLGLIVSFSLGLAAVLIAIGVLLVRSRSLVDRVGRLGGRMTTVLPLASAVIVTLLGIGIAFRGVTAYMA